MKVAFLLSLAAGIMTMVAVWVLWSVLDSANVFVEVGDTLREVTGGDQGDGFDLVSFLSLERVLAFTGIIAGIEVVVLTALTTLGAFLYNVSSRMVGGVEVTLAEDD